MSLKNAAAVILALGLLAGGTRAAELDLFGGTSIPFGTSKGGFLGQKSGGVDVGAAYGIGLNPVLDLVLEAGLHRLPNHEDFPQMSSMRVVDVTANLRVQPCDCGRLDSYFFGGVGVAQISFHVDAPLEWTSTSTELEVRIGGGADYEVAPRWKVFAEALILATDHLSAVPLRGGVRYAL
jgi:hypothetical protein